MTNLEFNKSLSKIYNKKGLMERYGGDLYITIIILFVTSVIFFYIHISNNLVPIKKNWSLERCNPLVMPLAGFINNTNKSTKSDLQYTIDNFNFCLQNSISSVFNTSIGSFNDSLSDLSSLFSDISSILSSFINFIASVIKAIINLFLKIWNLLLQNTTYLQLLLNKMRDTISKIIGIVVTILYFQMFSFRTSLAWMIATPIFHLYAIIFPQFISLLIGCLAVQVLTTGRWLAFGWCSLSNTVQNPVSLSSLSSFGTMIASFASAIVQALSSVPALLTTAISAVTLAISTAMTPAAPGTASAATLSINGLASAISALAGTVSTGIASMMGMILAGIATILKSIAGAAGCILGSSAFVYQFFAWIKTIGSLIILLASLLLLIILFMFVKITLKGMVVGDNGAVPGLGS